jgi:hypothetical protein
MLLLSCWGYNLLSASPEAILPDPAGTVCPQKTAPPASPLGQAVPNPASFPSVKGLVERIKENPLRGSALTTKVKTVTGFIGSTRGPLHAAIASVKANPVRGFADDARGPLHALHASTKINPGKASADAARGNPYAAPTCAVPTQASPAKASVETARAPLLAAPTRAVPPPPHAVLLPPPAVPRRRRSLNSRTDFLPPTPEDPDASLPVFEPAPCVDPHCCPGPHGQSRDRSGAGCGKPQWFSNGGEDVRFGGTAGGPEDRVCEGDAVTWGAGDAGGQESSYFGNAACGGAPSSSLGGSPEEEEEGASYMGSRSYVGSQTLGLHPLGAYFPTYQACLGSDVAASWLAEGYNLRQEAFA